MKTNLLFVSIFFVTQIFGQHYTQVIRGTVNDKDSKTPLIGASVVLVGSNPLKGTVTDENGKFYLREVPIGRQSIKISYIGYGDSYINNVIVNSAKEVVLDLELEEKVIMGEEIVVLAHKKEETVNKLAMISARSFTVEETEKYAGSRGDVARMATNFAGVMAANDQRNDIIIRGNSPSGLLWRLEDVDIPNPNHFAENGTTGGPVGMLNNNVLMNSDFFTGAWPAQYGNGLSGVFDLHMRNGNNEKREYMFQSGFNGFELNAEGPFMKGHKASYLFNIRYNDLTLFEKMGMNFGTSGIPKYLDGTFKINIPTTKGKISIFGIAGKSSISMLDTASTETLNLYSPKGTWLINKSSMLASGLSYTHFFNSKTHAKFTLSGTYSDGGTTGDSLDANDNFYRFLDHSYVEYKLSAGITLNSKHNNRLTSRSGIAIDKLGFDLNTRVLMNGSLFPFQNFSEGINTGPSLLRTYYNIQYRPNEKITITPGLHLTYFDFNKSFALEPRIAASYAVSNNQKVSVGYGLHSKIQSLYSYFYLTQLNDGSFVKTNEDLGLLKSHHLVAGYDIRFTENLRLKTEIYYQYLFNIPVEQNPSPYSVLNTGASWGFDIRDSLVNNGTGRNVGIEFTLEKFFSNNYYYLTTISIYDSKYKGSDNIERNTAFNGNYVINSLFGKEFKLNEKSTLALDLKMTFAGGKRYTPIDIVESKKRAETVFFEDQTFSKQFDPFFKVDAKIAYRLNGKRVSQEWQFYVENLTNHQNILMQNFDVISGEIINAYQLPMFPMVLYRIHF